jgi:CRP/FNR family transcriptional regulator, cyclic AMP receptor protein
VGFGKRWEIAMALKKTGRFDWQYLLAEMPYGKTVLESNPKRHIYRQGDPADSVFFLQRGRVKHSVMSRQGKEAIVAVLNAGDFFGEGCLAGQPLRMATATAMTPCTLVRIEKPTMVRMLDEQHDISEPFVTNLLSRNTRCEEDLVDQLFSSSEAWLARILLLL